MNTNGNERNKWFQSHSRKARIFSNSVEQSSNCTLRPVQQQGRPINLAANSSFPDLTNCSVLLHPFAQAVGLYWFCKSTSKQEAGANFAVLWCCSRARRRGPKPTAGSVRQDVREDHRDAALLWNRQRSNDVCKSCSGTLIALMTPCVWLLRTSSRRWGLIYFSPHVAINDTLPFFFFFLLRHNLSSFSSFFVTPRCTVTLPAALLPHLSYWFITSFDLLCSYLQTATDSLPTITARVCISTPSAH